MAYWAGEPWNYGWLERLRNKWDLQTAELADRLYPYHPESENYGKHPRESYCKSDRYATPLYLSSKLYNSKDKV